MKHPYASRSIIMEWYLAVLLFLWSSCLLVPLDYFDRVISFVALNSISATTNWGVAGIITSVFQMISLRANWHVFGKEARFISAIIGIGFWSLLFYSAFKIPQPNVAWLWYGSYVLAWAVCGLHQISAWKERLELPRPDPILDRLLIQYHEDRS